MATIRTMSDQELQARLDAAKLFESIDQGLRQDPDYHLHNPILRRSAFIIAYQGGYAGMYPIAVTLFGKKMGDQLPHASSWYKCLSILKQSPDYRMHVNTVRKLLDMRSRAIYEVKPFFEDYTDIANLMQRTDRLLHDLYTFRPSP